MLRGGPVIQRVLLRWAQAYLPYFLRKRSIRPAVSTRRCLPVKKGWHAEQMSTRTSFIVERV